jgi:hypothetical protein
MVSASTYSLTTATSSCFQVYMATALVSTFLHKTRMKYIEKNPGSVLHSSIFYLQMIYNIIMVPCLALFLFIFVLFLRYIHYASSGYSFFLSWVSDSCIWVNNFLPAVPREGIESGAVVEQPNTITTWLRCTPPKDEYCTMSKIDLSLCETLTH